MKRIIRGIIAAVIVLGIVAAFFWPRPKQITLTGTVTTDEIVVGPEIQGRVQRLLVQEGDIVTNGQLLAVLQPQEWRAQMAFYSHSQEQSKADVTRAAAELKFQEAQSSNQIAQAEASLAAAQAQVTQGEADLENFTLTLKRETDLYHRGVDPVQAYDQARTAQAGAEARVESLRKQVAAAQAAVALAQSGAEETAARRAALAASESQSSAAAAQTELAQVRLDYTEVRAPTNGVVNVRAALQGEVVNPGQAIVTLINPDDLWVRADVEETYVDRIRLGDSLPVRLPSGVERPGTVFFRGVDSDYATQRDVSRSKRDIKTFEIRLSCDNHDRALAVGMTAFVTAPLERR
ncbi:MAG TPA: efflux RND transporter periplasmic adaptor subunit [Verrucomicrobiae bacterium]|jgi:multidrug resistance efflux pump|nr:efflux RND transporter periplasmic adaptor subunit [Verrucomicrobiae bacterium]